MIQPTPGRVVWYYPPVNAVDPGFANPQDGAPLAAIVAYVWSDRCVNLMVLDASGTAHARGSVFLLQDGDPRPLGDFCEWMPYQKGQAAKAENPVGDAVTVIRKAAQEDPDYAWTWHCNVAMSFVDEGGDPAQANRAAARFLNNLFDIDTTTHVGFDPTWKAVETKEYVDGTSATGVAPLPDLSPAQQRKGEFLQEDPDHAHAD